MNGHHHIETGRPFNDGIETRVIDVDELPLGVARTQTHGLEELDALGAVADLPLKSLGLAGAPARLGHAIPRNVDEELELILEPVLHL